MQINHQINRNSMKLIQKLQSIAALMLAVAGLAIHSQAGEFVPSKGRVAGQNTFAVYTANPFDAQGNPILGLTFRYTETEGFGHATRLGNFAITTRNFVQFAIVDGALVAKVYGDWIITTANGDQIWGTHDYIRPLSGPLTFAGTTTTTGGSGHFEGTTGLSEFAGIIYPDPATGLDSFEYEWEGVGASVGFQMRNR
jgi:hypothetical protein